MLILNILKYKLVVEKYEMHCKFIYLNYCYSNSHYFVWDLWLPIYVDLIQMMKNNPEQIFLIDYQSFHSIQVLIRQY